MSLAKETKQTTLLSWLLPTTQAFTPKDFSSKGRSGKWKEPIDGKRSFMRKEPHDKATFRDGQDCH